LEKAFRNTVKAIEARDRQDVKGSVQVRTS